MVDIIMRLEGFVSLVSVPRKNGEAGESLTLSSVIRSSTWAHTHTNTHTHTHTHTHNALSVNMNENVCCFLHMCSCKCVCIPACALSRAALTNS
jgi:hypothetical protein